MPTPTLRPDVIEALNAMRPEVLKQISTMSDRDFKSLRATTDLMMLAGEGEPDPEKRVERGAKEFREVYFLGRNAKAGVKFLAATGLTFFAALQWGADAWNHIKSYIQFLAKGGGQ